MPFIDSNVFIYHLANDPEFGGRATSILTSVERGERSHTSTWVIHQVTSYLRWKRFYAAIPAFLNLLRSLVALDKHETTFVDLTSAYELQQVNNLPWRLWDDIVIAAQMNRLGIEEIYSNDADFDTIPHVKRIF